MMTTEKVTKQKDPKKVEAGRKGHQAKLLKMKEQILNDTSTTTNPSSTATSTATNPSSTSASTASTATSSASSNSDNPWLIIAGIGVVGALWYFYQSPPTYQKSSLPQAPKPAPQPHQPTIDLATF